MNNQKLAGLVGGYLAIATLIMFGLTQTLNIDMISAALASVVAALLICGFAVSLAGQPVGGPAAARNFFSASVAHNSRAVVVVTSPADLSEVLYQLKLNGWQPSVVQAAI